MLESAVRYTGRIIVVGILLAVLALAWALHAPFWVTALATVAVFLSAVAVPVRFGFALVSIAMASAFALPLAPGWLAIVWLTYSVIAIRRSDADPHDRFYDLFTRRS